MSSHQFAHLPKANVQRSVFNRSHGHKTTFDGGYLVPILADEALPGDIFHLKTTVFARLATPLKPPMDNLYLDTFYFSVPIRLIWDDFEKFMGAQTNPGDSTDFLVPHVNASPTGFARGSLMDYLGVPPNVPNLSINALFHRAYRLIFNEHFRDQNLQDTQPVNTGPGPDDILHAVQLFHRGKRHDYFTSCLPFLQKGQPVNLPLGGYANVVTNALAPTFIIEGQPRYDNTSMAATKNENSRPFKSFGFLGPTVGVPEFDEAPVHFGDQSGLRTDLSTATAVTINTLRQAIMVQNLLETDARGGTRYTEVLKAHFGVTSPDFRLQRPEYLGGSSEPILIRPVPQTSSTDSETPQGNLSAYGLVSGKAGFFHHSFTEHCIIIGMASVRADLTYQQGINRMFSRLTKYDFYWPALAHLGEQAVLNREIYAQGTDADVQVFGYQERWAEYRYKPSIISGKFRSSDPQSLDFWHLSQDFANLPVLSGQFITENPPIERIIAVPSEPQILFDAYFDLKCIRPMPTYSIPGLGSRF